MVRIALVIEGERQMYRRVEWPWVPRQGESVQIIEKYQESANTDGWSHLTVDRIEWRLDGTAYVFLKKNLKGHQADLLVQNHHWMVEPPDRDPSAVTQWVPTRSGM